MLLVDGNLLTGRGNNCWEFQRCGRGPADGGQCPVSSSDCLDGVHGGSAAGRACWVVEGTLCEGTPSGPFERKMTVCGKCAFYHRVAVEEGLDYVPVQELHERYLARS